MRITFVAFHLGAGGAERVLVNMANHWVSRGHHVSVLTLQGEHPIFFPLHDPVRVRQLGVAAVSTNPVAAIAGNARRIRCLRAAIAGSAPDAVISFTTEVNVLTLFATRGSKVPVFVEEHTDPAVSREPAVWRWLRSRTYGWATNVVVLSDEASAFFPPRIRTRTRVIPNAIATGAGRQVPRSGAGARQLVALGRLDAVKGFDRLLEVFAEIAPVCPAWRLAIWGEGPERETLTALRERLGLADRVSLPGATTDPGEVLRAADLFVMTSRREGFPMALGEALACGLPAVSFDCPSGPRQLIRHEIDGLLVPDGDRDGLAQALCRLMCDDDLRARFAARAPEVVDRFGADRVMGLWETMIGQATTSPFALAMAD